MKKRFLLAVLSLVCVSLVDHAAAYPAGRGQQSYGATLHAYSAPYYGSAMPVRGGYQPSYGFAQRSYRALGHR